MQETQSPIDLTALDEVSLRALVARSPHHVEALDLLGNRLIINGLTTEGAEYICRAYVLKPAESQPPRMRGIAFYILGRIDEAADVYKGWLAREPGNAMARHLYASCSGAETPSRASDGFIRSTFDDYAPIFDDRLRQLGYRVPEDMVQCVRDLAAPAKQWDILDAGCGTGWLGPLIQPWAKTLTGVDISAGMLAQATQRACYDTLVESELCAFLARQNDPACEVSQGVFDLIALADTLIYFGDLSRVIELAATCSKPRAHLLFNIELDSSKTRNDKVDSGGTGYTLVPSGRYQHQRKYIEACLADNAYGLVGFSEIDTRTELGTVIKGALVLAQRREAA